MKKTIAMLVLGGAICSSFAQGTLTFNNAAATLISTNTVHGGPATGTTSPVLGSWYYALLTAPTTTTTYAGNNDPNWTFRAIATNSANATGGRLVGGQPTTVGIAGGSTLNFIIRGWSANLGATWSEVLNSLQTPAGIAGGSYYLGQSAIGLNAIFNDPAASPVNPAFGTGGGSTVPGFTLDFTQVPEPSSMALAGLGAASLLLFRRDRKSVV